MKRASFVGRRTRGRNRGPCTRTAPRGRARRRCNARGRSPAPARALDELRELAVDEARRRCPALGMARDDRGPLPKDDAVQGQLLGLAGTVLHEAGVADERHRSSSASRGPRPASWDVGRLRFAGVSADRPADGLPPGDGARRSAPDECPVDLRQTRGRPRPDRLHVGSRAPPVRCECASRTAGVTAAGPARQSR